MTGLFLLAVLGLWTLFVVKFSRWIGARFRGGSWQRVASVFVFALLLPLPVADEIVGGFQFRALCKANAAEFRVGVANPEGRTARVTVDPSNRYLDSSAIPIRHSRVTYRDAATEEQLVVLDRYVAEGGMLVRALGISENNSPLTLGISGCSPEDARRESARLTFKLNVVK
jgi:hypothetical protein